MIVKIYLRSILKDGEFRLAMFDSHRSGDIDNLLTEVEAGATIIWKLDCLSGIKSIIKIYSKTGERNVFITDPEKQLLGNGFRLQLSKDAKGEEPYSIEYTLCNNAKLTIDPVIRIPPPPTKL